MRETLHLSWILPKPITSNSTHISTKVSRTHHDLPSPGQDDVVEDCDEGWWYSFSVFILQSFLKDGKYPSPVSTVLQPSPDPGLHTTCHSHDGLPSRQVSNLQLHIIQNSRPLGVRRCVFLGKNGSTITAEPARFASVLMAKLLLLHLTSHYQAMQEKLPCHVYHGSKRGRRYHWRRHRCAQHLRQRPHSTPSVGWRLS